MRKQVMAWLSVSLGMALVAVPLATRPAQAAPADHLVINEFYGRGGSANQPYTNKFVELYNPTSAAIDLSGLSVQYRSATGTAVANGVAALSGSLAGGDFYVLQMNSNGTVGSPLPASVVDQTSTLAPSGTTGTVFVARSTAAINPATQADLVIDKLGYGTSNSPEAVAAAYTGANADPGSLTRTGASDTDNNSVDFTFTATPTPGTDASIGTGPGPDPAPVTTIAGIQGTGPASTLVGSVVTTTGVVTAAYPTGGFNGAYLQTPGTGGAAKQAGDASDGIFVFGTQAANAPIGSCFTVVGTVTEFNGLTELTSATLTPASGCAPVIPTPIAVFPATDADKEPLEGMLVQPSGPYTITNNYQLNQFGQLGLAVGTEPLYTATDAVVPAEAPAYEAANKARLITLDDGSSWNYLTNTTAKRSPLPYLSADTPMRTASGVTFTGPVILDYRFQWNYQPTTQVVGPTQTFLTSTNDRPAAPTQVGGDLRLATFNVLNYFTDLGKHETGCRAYTDLYGTPVATNGCQVRGAWSAEAFADQQSKIVSAVNGLGADVVGLEEIETSSAISYLPGQDRDKALAALVAALNAAGGNWAFVPSPTVVPPNEDVIRTAFIYNPATVSPTGPSYILIDPAFANARQPLAQEFTGVGTRTSFVVITNHFKSKGSGEDDGTGQGLSNPAREAQATALTGWADDQFAGKPVFLVGDFNAYSRETPVQIIEAAGYTNLSPGADAEHATYQFDGRLGSLDHVFANAAARALVSGATVWNINADESTAFQYSRRLYNVTDFFAPDAYASSDHDPAVVGILTVKLVPPAVLAHGVADCDSFGFTVTGDAPAGATLRISWTRDGQGQSTTVDTLQWWSGNGQLGWSDARAELLDADGRVIAASGVLNPTCTAPVVSTGPNTVSVATAGLPTDAVVTVTVTYSNRRVLTFTDPSVDAEPYRIKVPGYESVTVSVTQGQNLIGYSETVNPRK